ncbi:PIN domain-like protein [Amanita rubescens]|nr:PIN domain-like protein [Amanita rubescens]
MGVLGLTPFLQKVCPDVIKHLPDRLKGLTGKRIVIDGTLITQRMHFAPVPHQYRHVLGWYRLVKELEDSGVSAICVFDGKERNLAKAREAVRRREARQLVAARSSLELKRLQRLQKLKGIWKQWKMLDRNDRSRISDLINALDFLQPKCTPLVSFEPESKLDNRTQVLSIEDEQGPLHQDALSPSTDRIQDLAFPVIPPVLSAEDARATVEMSPPEIAKQIAVLFLDYHRSISQLKSLPPSISETPLLPVPQSTVDSDARAELFMSKGQYQLTIEEGRLWSKILTPQEQLEPVTDIAVNDLTQKSSIMSASYTRRTCAPTSKTYDESREILQAMGIPCVESTGTFEAEALASAIVRQGLADYVVSEDTDVLLYEVPLLRNITSRHEPLMMMTGSDVRTMLELDYDSFIDFALLLGTDFSERIKNLGPARALKFIREYGTIERVIASETKYTPRLPADAYLAEVELARTIFRTLPPVPDEDQLIPKKRDDDEVVQLLQRFSLGREVLLREEWNYEAALAGNYFADDPRMY